MISRSWCFISCTGDSNLHPSLKVTDPVQCTAPNGKNCFLAAEKKNHKTSLLPLKRAECFIYMYVCARACVYVCRYVCIYKIFYIYIYITPKALKD